MTPTSSAPRAARAVSGTLERLPDVPDDVVALRAAGTFTAAGLLRAVTPHLVAARERSTRVRLLLQFAEDFRFVPGTPPAWPFDPTLARAVDGCALVGDHDWVHGAAGLAGLVVAAPVRAFPAGDRAAALAWLGPPSAGRAVSSWLDPATGVLVVEIDAPLRPAEVDALRAEVDGWLATRDALPGVVLHVPVFPGWTTVTSLLNQVRSTRDLRGRPRRIALVAADPLVPRVPRPAGHVPCAGVRSFGVDDLGAAIAWAGDPGPDSAPVIAGIARRERPGDREGAVPAIRTDSGRPRDRARHRG